MGLGDRAIAAIAKLACRFSKCCSLDNILFPARPSRRKDDAGYVWGRISGIYEKNSSGVPKVETLILVSIALGN